jgi:hypothetical protein
MKPSISIQGGHITNWINFINSTQQYHYKQPKHYEEPHHEAEHSSPSKFSILQ